MDYKGPMDCFKKIMKHEGFAKLFSGMLPPLATSSIVNAIIFSTYGYVNKMLSVGEEKPTLANIYVSGCVAGFMQTFIACPCELVKIKLQAKSEGKQSMRKVVNNIFRAQGFRGFFRGYESTFYRDTPAFGAYFLSYYLMMDQLEKPLGSVMAAFISGGAAGAVSWGVIYPMDIVKSKIQMSSLDVPVKSTYAMIRDIYKAKGMKALYRGCGTTILRSFPVNAVLFPVYETCVLLLGSDQE
jgi:solute carrier family 25 carnitine/acylcarnitine transporter 20/29